MRFHTRSSAIGAVGIARHQLARSVLILRTEDLSPGELGCLAYPAREEAGSVFVKDFTPVGVSSFVEDFIKSWVAIVYDKGYSALRMVLQVLSDIGIVDQGLDSKQFEQLGIANTGEFEHLRGFHCAARDYDFFRAVCYVTFTVNCKVQASRDQVAISVVREHDIGNDCFGNCMQIWSL